MTEDKFYATFNSDGFATGFYQTAAMSDRSSIPEGAIEFGETEFGDLCEYAGLRKWDGSKIVVYDPPAPEPVIPDRLSRRQFRLALIDAGLLEQVEAWVSTQDIRTQAAYADSSTFLRTDEMLKQGFSGLGFTKEQIDTFFAEAAAL